LDESKKYFFTAAALSDHHAFGRNSSTHKLFNPSSYILWRIQLVSAIHLTVRGQAEIIRAFPLPMMRSTMTHYTQLTQEQRYQIYALNKAGFTQKAIAIDPGVHPSTISREPGRNTGPGGYRPTQVHSGYRRIRRCSQGETRVFLAYSPATDERLNVSSKVIGLRNRSPGACMKNRAIESAMNGFISIFIETKTGRKVVYHYLRCQKQRKKRYGSRNVEAEYQIKR